jgi:hypothetical protein
MKEQNKKTNEIEAKKKPTNGYKKQNERKKVCEKNGQL